MSTLPDAKLLLQVAADHGLDARAAALLDGETLEAVESSAAALAALVGRRTKQEEPTDPLATARAEKARSKQALLAALSGRREQPRDDLGRYGSFDGGARAPVPGRGDPEAEHSALAARLMLGSRQARGAADAGAGF